MSSLLSSELKREVEGVLSAAVKPALSLAADQRLPYLAAQLLKLLDGESPAPNAAAKPPPPEENAQASDVESAISELKVGITRALDSALRDRGSGAHPVRLIAESLYNQAGIASPVRRSSVTAAAAVAGERRGSFGGVSTAAERRERRASFTRERRASFTAATKEAAAAAAAAAAAEANAVTNVLDVPPDASRGDADAGVRKRLVGVGQMRKRRSSASAQGLAMAQAVADSNSEALRARPAFAGRDTLECTARRARLALLRGGCEPWPQEEFPTAQPLQGLRTRRGARPRGRRRRRARRGGDAAALLLAAGD